MEKRTFTFTVDKFNNEPFAKCKNLCPYCLHCKGISDSGSFICRLDGSTDLVGEEDTCLAKFFIYRGEE